MKRVNLFAVVGRIVVFLVFLAHLGSCAPNRQQRSLIMAVANDNKAEVTALLSKGADVNKTGTRSFKGVTPLILAAKKGYTEIIHELLTQKNIDLNAVDPFGSTALIEAARYGHLEIVRALLDRGANVDARDNYGVTPLMRAADRGHREIAQTLLASGADANARSQKGSTPLMEAAENRFSKGGACEIVRDLLEEGADVNAINADGSNPLMVAVSNNEIETVRLLLEKGAYVNAKNMRGWTPLLLAAGIQYEMKPVFQKSTTTENTISNLFAMKSLAAREKTIKAGPETVLVLLNHGAEVNSSTTNGTTALMITAALGRIEVVKLLLSYGANVDAVNKHGLTARDFARNNEQPEIMKLLSY